MLLAALLPDVPVAVFGDALLLPGEPLLALGLPDVLLPLDALPAAADDPMRALVSVYCAPPVARLLPVVAPVVPLVPVAPAVPPLPCRHPVTVTVRVAPAPAVWLPVVEPACADMVAAAQPSTIANVALVHSLFIRIPPFDTRPRRCNRNAMACSCAKRTPAVVASVDPSCPFLLACRGLQLGRA
jgi:hypothetical protein